MDYARFGTAAVQVATAVVKKVYHIFSTATPFLLCVCVVAEAAAVSAGVT